MSKGITVAPWRPIPGTGQSLALTSGADASFSAVGTQTRAVALALAPAATAAACLVRVGHAATASTDILLKTTDPPFIMACGPGDVIHAWGLASGLTLYLTELTN